MKKLNALIVLFAFIGSAGLFCEEELRVFVHWYDSAISRVVASSTLEDDTTNNYSYDNLLDRTYQSWVEGVPGNGIGESFTLTLDTKEPIAGFALKNGYGDLNYYAKNNRVRSFRIYFDDVYSETIAIKDSIHFEQYAFKTPVSCKEIRFVIDSVYQGTVYDDTCVAEIALLGNIVSADVFYKTILELGTGGATQYTNHNDALGRVSDPDRMGLMGYLPFAIPRFFEETNIALLNNPSTLQLRDRLPRLDGATALYPLYSAFVHAVYPEPVIDRTKNNDDYDYYNQDDFHRYFDQYPYYPNDEFSSYYQEIFSFNESHFSRSIVQCNKTDAAYQRLIDGETDIIFCYAPSLAQIEAARAKGLNFHTVPIGKDSFVFIVNEKNVLNSITQQQIRDIYSGRLTNWKSISGVDDIIIPYPRPENSGSQTILQSIMRGGSPIKPILDGEYVPQGMSDLVRMVASDYYNYNSAIGYSFLFYLNQMADRRGVKVLSVNGIAPTRQTIQDNSYPFTQTIYAVTTGNETQNVRDFLNWILSYQGQDLVEKTGYVPISFPFRP
jgi:phosphate transport system substrate-binding protein